MTYAKLYEAYAENALGEYSSAEYIDLRTHPTQIGRGTAKIVAYYLPQFHPIKENDLAWGKGFTEWRNVTRAFPHFEGHYQPRLPGELGYYDLRVPTVMKRQVELAKLYGISAFCFHFYWFGGERLLERPIEHFLNTKDLDIEFSLCWANENWSRRWDGSKNELIRAQNHSPDDDIAFIRYLGKYFSDQRYMKVGGKPVLTIYRPSILPDMAATVRRWRNEVQRMGFPGIYLIAANTFRFYDYKKFDFDALSEFPPHNSDITQLKELRVTPKRKGGLLLSYPSLVAFEEGRESPEGVVHPGIMPGWDNSARRPHDGTIFYDSNPALFRRWLDHCLDRANRNPPGERFIFVNAWNEWAEGAYLEPDRRYGYAYLSAIADALEGRLAFNENRFVSIKNTSRLEARLFEEYVENSLAAQKALEYVELSDVCPEAGDVRLIAYYLPQFHPIPENDIWWGKGFTEWRNVARAFPLFEGHYQPRKPSELGYYDLRVPDVMRRQIELAKLYGISAFCFHFYWFGGKRLLELPLENYLNNASFDLPFCLCWANENWSRRWDGSEHEVLIAQNHSEEDDEAFLRYIDKYFRDDRYLKIDGKPILTVYRPAILKDAAATTARWRRIAKELGYPGLYLIATNAFSFQDYEKLGFDALSEFPPHVINAPNIQDELSMSPLRTGWRVRRYADVVAAEKARWDFPDLKVHPGVMPSWDNSARRPTAGEIIHGSTPSLFREWLDHAFKRAKKNPRNERLVFINAWNEWAEGAYLEPDQRFGYAYLDVCASVVLKHCGEDESDGSYARRAIEWRTVQGRRERGKDSKTILLCSHYIGAQIFGGERSFIDVACALSDSGFNVVATLQDDSNSDYVGELKAHVTQICVFPYDQWQEKFLSSFESIESIQSFIAVIDRIQPDLVYVNTIVMRAPLIAAKIRGIPAIIHAREIIAHDLAIQQQIGLNATQIEQQLVRSCDCIVANSRVTANNFPNCSFVETVPNIIDPKPFDISNDVVDGVVKFGLISSNERKKGIEDFIKLARLCREAVPNARFLVIGSQVWGWIQDYISGRKEYPDNIQFVDYQPSSLNVIRLVNVVVNFSLFQESFGRTVLEGMAAGRPALAYDWGALGELVVHGQTGFLVPFKRPELAVQYVKLLCEDVVSVARLGKAARLRANTTYSPDLFRSKLSDACHRTIRTRNIDGSVYSDSGTERIASVKSKTIDIVVCVHNALDDVKMCLSSVERNLGDGHRLLIVDDGSDENTQTYLRDFARGKSSVVLFRNNERTGYTKAANRGIRETTADFVVLLNSDTVVTERWAEKMAGAVFSTPAAGIVSPMSNAASYQSLPDVESSEDQTAVNTLPLDCTPDDMNRLCENLSQQHFPIVALVHGFCFGITRETLDILGGFDEINFEDGYGEENDYCLRAFRVGIWPVIATNTFVYHAKSRSYTKARRRLLARKAQVRLYKLHGRLLFDWAIAILEDHPTLQRMRASIHLMNQSKIEKMPKSMPKLASPANLSALSDSDWLSMLKRSASFNIVDGVMLPGFPDEGVQAGSVGSAGEATMSEAFVFYSFVRNLASKVNAPLKPTTKILDFGAGWGRIIRCFLRDIDSSNLHGVDVSATYLHAAQKCGISNFRLISPTGSLPYPDSSFDIVYAYSVFTHLPKDVQDIWLPEISRVLRPGGLLVATVEPPRFHEFIKNMDDETKEKHAWFRMLSDALAKVPNAEQALASEGFLFLRTNNIDTYGDTIMTSEYIQSQWGKHFRILDYLDDPKQFFQAVVSAQKN